MRHFLALLLTSTATMAEVPRVVTDIPPVHSIVAMVMGDLGTPELLLGKGADEHDFQLKPSQMTAVTEAGLVIWIGPELTPWLDSALDARGGDGTVLTLFDDVGTYKINYFVSAVGGEEVPDHDAEAAEEGHEDHAEGTEEAGHDDHAGEEGHDDHDHGAGSIDPHVWLDPSTAQYWTGMIAAELSRLDPENAATYGANAEAASAAIAAAEAEAKALLEPVKDRPFVTFHDAYGYYINYFGLTPAGTIALGDAASPGAARLSDLRATLETGAALCIFPEVQHDPALVEQMAEGTGARIGAALDPVGSSLEPGPDAYAALITGTAKTIADCLAD
jgi:zinc transport system substrate-binding protein